MKNIPIKVVEEEAPEDRYVLGLLRSYVRNWVIKKFGKLTLPQRYAIPRVKDNRNILLFSPTGTGKTLAAFLSILDELFMLGEKGELEDRVYAIYISPLRALSNDIRRNLQIPLEEIRKIAQEEGINLPDIRAMVRTGDTPQSERARMLRKPPHILITTPESFAIILNAPKFREKLRNVRWVIIDEVHELSGNKRGAHLSLALERLVELAGEFIRIGLSATQAPVKEIAKWLVGLREGSYRQCDIIKIPMIKALDLRVIAPTDDLRNKEKTTNATYSLIKKYLNKYKTILIFTNTRSGAENVAHKLSELLGSEHSSLLGTHHSSLSKDIRLEVEEKLKKGELKAVVTSTSLELGIDIGYIDLVVQIGSPKSVSKGLQRIGRAGHALHKVSRGRLIALDEDDLVEDIVLVDYAYKGIMDKVRIPKNPLDVLAQHIVGMSLEKKWNVNEAFSVIRRSYNFKDLSWDDFISVLRYLGGYYVDLEYRGVYRKIWFDEKEGVFGRKRNARMIYFLNIGTIPEEANYDVILVDSKRKRMKIGKLSEPFVERLLPGDVFVLGGRKYRLLKIKGNSVFVSTAEEEKPTVPSWIGEMLPRSWELSIGVGKFRKMLKEILINEGEEKARKWLKDNFRLNKNAITNIIRYFKHQINFFNFMPTHNEIFIEPFIDENGRPALIFHVTYGRRVNDALSRALAYIASNHLNVNVAIGVTDNGFILTFPKGTQIDIPLLIDRLLKSDLKDILTQAIKDTELFAVKFRHCAVRSFMILRAYRGKVISVERRKLKADKLIKDLGLNFPIIKETLREIMEDYMDLHHAKEVIEKIRNGKIVVKIVKKTDLTLPSPLAHNIILAAQSDILTMEDREKWIMEIYRKLLLKVAPLEKAKEGKHTNSVVYKD